MKLLFYITAILAICQLTWAYNYNMTCYYDTSSINRGGKGNFTTRDLEVSLQYCTQIVYGYVGIDANSFRVIPLEQKQHQIFNQIKQLKKKHSSVKFLLSLGGDKDLKQSDKYMRLLEAAGNKQEQFIKSAIDFMRKYSFDGLDLAYQFPHTKPQKHHSKIGGLLSHAKTFLIANKEVDKSANRHKKLFSNLVYQLRTAFKRSKHMLTLTVLPHVNSTLYFDVFAIMPHLDYVNLGTFDYSTPQRTPHEADYLAPIYPAPRTASRVQQPNIDNEVRYWISQHAPAKKLNIGIATYGRTWKIKAALKSQNMPIVKSLDGPALGGVQTHTTGLLSRAEFCNQVTKMSKQHDRKFGDYAYRAGNVKGEQGLLITYESPESVADKVTYVHNLSLGGVAVFDLSLDDFNDQCKTGKFPILKQIKFKLF